MCVCVCVCINIWIFYLIYLFSLDYSDIISDKSNSFIQKSFVMVIYLNRFNIYIEIIIFYFFERAISGYLR